VARIVCRARSHAVVGVEVLKSACAFFVSGRALYLSEMSGQRSAAVSSASSSLERITPLIIERARFGRIGGEVSDLVEGVCLSRQ
jgi:hypothetical protein